MNFMRKILVLLLALACLISSSACAESMTLAQLLTSDVWVLSHNPSSQIQFNADGTGVSSGYDITWKASLFGVSAECEMFGTKITANYNLISENDIPFLALSDDPSTKLIRRCDLTQDQSAPVAESALTAEQAINILTSESWSEAKTDSNHYIFNPDGTGKMDLGSSFSIDTTWTFEGDLLTLRYNFYGERMLLCTLTEVDGMYQLRYGESSFLVREQDAQTLIAAARSEINAYAAAVGEPIALGFTNLTFENAMTSRKVIGPSKSGSTLPDKPGYTYLTVLGTIKNNTTSQISMRNLRAEIMLDDAYIYPATVMAELGEKLSYDMSAQATGKLYISAELPVDIAESFTSATAYLGFNDGFTTAPSSVTESNYIFSFDLTDDIIASAKRGPIRKMEYFEECPVLPMPSSYADVRYAGRSSSSTNGKTTRIEYRFSLEFNEDNLSEITASYKNELAAMGFTVNGGEVFADKKKIATVSLNGNSLTVNIVPGNEKLKFTPVASNSKPVVQEEEQPEEIIYTLGQTLNLKSMQMSLDKVGTGTIYSSITPRRSGYYQYLESEAGSELFYLTGTYKSLHGTPIDIRNIYAEFIFDDKYTYRAHIEAGKPESNIFFEEVSPMESVTYYIYAQIPESVVSSYKTCTARLGFTDDFGYIYTVNGLPDFDRCNNVFTVSLAPSAAPSYETLKPGSNGQAVLNARIKLFELGYFSKMPTRTDYTNDMANYVKQFERDHGLHPDGILSPEDQEVLFGL